MRAVQSCSGRRRSPLQAAALELRRPQTLHSTVCLLLSSPAGRCVQLSRA